MDALLLGPLLPESGAEIGRVILISAAVYAFVIASHRLVGKRAASQMNNFDWIVTVAMGAIMGSTILAERISLAEGMTAVATLLALQYGVTRATVEWRWFQKTVQAGPRLLYYEGVSMGDALKDERITDEEVLHAARDAGHRSLDEVGAVVLESDGTLSVLPCSGAQPPNPAPLLSNVSGLPSYADAVDDPARPETDSSDGDGAEGKSSDAGSPIANGEQ